MAEIDVGHLIHIENGTRNPSHKVLKNITDSLNIPYHQLFSTYDKNLNQFHIDNNYIDYIPYNKVPAISKIEDYVVCPPKYSNASFAYKMTDDSMEPIIHKDSYVFVEANGVINKKEIGIFEVNNEFYIRKLLYKRNKFILKSNNRKFNDIIISDTDSFNIIGKIYF